MVINHQILEALQSDLTQERVLLPQIIAYIADHYQVTEDRLSEFFSTILPGLIEAEDDIALDLTFSPLFTPTLDDQARYAGLLQADSVNPTQIDQWIQELSNKGLTTPLKSLAGEHFVLPLAAVSIDRYVKRLLLTQTIHPQTAELILTTFPQAEQPLALTLARDAVWQGDARNSLLLGFLKAFHIRSSYQADKLVQLTDFVRTYRPGNLSDLERQLNSLIASCESDLSKVYGGSFHHPTLKEKYVERGEGVYEEDHDLEAAKTYMRLMDHARALLADCREIEASKAA